MNTEIDVSDTTLAKSDQLNSDDLIAGPITVSIVSVSRSETNEQPIAIYITGGHQPFKPCKTMRRVLVAGWGKNAAAWVGKSMTLYRDPDVKWAGEKVGGIRISAMSDLSKPLELSLAESRKSKRRTVVEVLTVAPTKHKFQAHLDNIKKRYVAVHGGNITDKAVLAEAFADWVYKSTNGAVLTTDAGIASMYTQDVIDHLTAILSEAT